MSAPREPLAVVVDEVVSCPSCRVDFADFPDASEAQYFAGVHNDLHGHGAVSGAHPVVVDTDGDDWANSPHVREWLAGAAERFNDEASTDALEVLRARVDALRAGIDQRAQSASLDSRSQDCPPVDSVSVDEDGW